MNAVFLNIKINPKWVREKQALVHTDIKGQKEKQNSYPLTARQ